MRKPTSFLACMLLLLTAWTGTAHGAALAPCNEPMSAEMVMHIAGDCDEVPGDPEKAYPHHHDGCHGQHISTAARDTVVLEQLPAEQSYGLSQTHGIFTYVIDRTLRPPRA